MDGFLRQSTATTKKIGPFTDATDGVTPETGLAGNGTEISKDGGAYASGPTLGTHDAEGEYPISLTTSHTDTVGILKVKSFDSSVHCPVWHTFQVIEEAVYDALFAASALGYVANAPMNAAQVGGQTASAAGPVTFPGTIASTTNITAGTLTTVTNLTNLPPIPNNWLTEAGIADFALAGSKFGDDCLAGQEIHHVAGDVGGRIIGEGTAAITGIGVWAAGAAGATLSTLTQAQIVTGGAIATNGGAVSTVTNVTNNPGLDASGIRAAIGQVSPNFDTITAAINAKTTNLPASPAAVGSAMTLANNAITTAAINDGAYTDAKFTVPTVTGVATGVLSRLVQTWMYHYLPSEYDPDAETFTTFATNGTTVVTTQSATVVGNVQRKGNAT
jgi:hypothetical protein